MVCIRKCFNHSFNKSCYMIEQSMLTRHRTAKRISKEQSYRIACNLTWNHIYSTVNDHCTLLNPVPLKIKYDHNLVIWICFKSSHWRVLSQRNKELIYFTWGLLPLFVIATSTMYVPVFETNLFPWKILQGSWKQKTENWASIAESMEDQVYRIQEYMPVNIWPVLYCI